MQDEIDHFKERGADCVLSKPLDTDVFESLFRNFRPRETPYGTEVLVEKGFEAVGRMRATERSASWSVSSHSHVSRKEREHRVHPGPGLVYEMA
jgi:hypothetical protein